MSHLKQGELKTFLRKGLFLLMEPHLCLRSKSSLCRRGEFCLLECVVSIPEFLILKRDVRVQEYERIILHLKEIVDVVFFLKARNYSKCSWDAAILFKRKNKILANAANLGAELNEVRLKRQKGLNERFIF